MLVRLLIENGFFMGKYRGEIGEDDERFGRLLWDDTFREFYVASWKYPQEQRLQSAVKMRLRLCHDEFLMDIITDKLSPVAVGFKNAVLVPYVAEHYREVLAEIGIRAKFIHLTRNPLNWMLSGRDPTSRGIMRPIRYPKFSKFSDPFNRIIWFGNLADQVCYGERVIDLSDFRAYSDEEQVILESMFWRTTNEWCQRFSHLPSDFIHLTYEDLVNRPESSLERLGKFTSTDLVVPKAGTAKIRQDRLAVEAEKMLGTQNCEHVAKICGSLMKKFGYTL